MMSRCQPRRRRRSGYVLLVVIAVTVLMVTVLGTLAKQSLRRGLEAADAERALQQRWGALTLERAMLPRAQRIFQRQEELASELTPGTPPPTTIRFALTLRGATFDVLLADEDAKVNVNSLYHHGGPELAAEAVTSLAGPIATQSVRFVPAVPPLLIPRENTKLGLDSDDADDPVIVPDAFRSWGEVFDLQGLQRRLGSDAALPNLTTGMTCWGNGQLNIRRASDAAILVVIGSVVQDGGARRILKRYRESPAASLSALLQTEVSAQRNRDRLSELLAETSTNFSLWMDASIPAGGSLRYFVVTQRDDEGVTRQSKFLH